MKMLMNRAAQFARRRLQCRSPNTARARLVLALYLWRLGRWGEWEAAVAKAILHAQYVPALRAASNGEWHALEQRNGRCTRDPRR